MTLRAFRSNSTHFGASYLRNTRSASRIENRVSAARSVRLRTKSASLSVMTNRSIVRYTDAKRAMRAFCCCSFFRAKASAIIAAVIEPTDAPAMRSGRMPSS